MAEDKKIKGKRVVLTVDDYNTVVNYLRNKPLPYLEAEPVIAALRRGVIADVDLNEKEESNKGDA